MAKPYKYRPRTHSPLANIKRTANKAGISPTALAELLTIIVPTLFLTSAFFSANVMGIRIGTDYFSLATTGDVLMNGVKALGYSAAISIALAAAFSIRSTIVWKKRLKETIKSRHSRDIRLTLLAFHYRRDFMNELFPFTASIFAILTISIAVFFASQPSGLYYVGGADLPQECKYQQAEWIGAQSSIINCQGTPWVIRDGENVRYLKPQKVCRLRLKLWQACEYVGLPRAPNERTATMANPIGRD